ncbi:glutathione S-transferase N-terminal domain-containing protein [Endozoicomonas sp. Mp262]|uniref:glutathione S-transferase N-terminal domain-containing protein n=1 Tax=Endozoicomonas sp. Mp262 TaxID=2919499 RepID=UPI0021D9FA33
MLNLFTSTLASSTRLWRGTSSSKSTVQPLLPLVLYDREACPRCRLVREALTELNLDVEIRPCPIDGQRFLQETPKGRLPFLVDPNTEKKLSRTGQIMDYLFGQYADRKPPSKFNPGLLNLAGSSLASSLRLNAGSRKVPSRIPEKPLKLYSFESSPYSRLVREQLSELELPYLLINLGKQQWADMGPASFRMSIRPYKPLPGTKRSLFFEEHGDVQVPYLEDPNTDTALFESRAIVKYLQRTYQAQ